MTGPNTSVPRRAILQELQRHVEELYWLYGVSGSDAQSRQERWDVRSILDFVVMNELFVPAIAKTTILYGSFYLARNQVMDLLIESLSCESGVPEKPTYGDWRMWETEKHRSVMDIVKVIQRARNTLMTKV